MTVSPGMAGIGPPSITVVTSSLTSLRQNVLPAVAGSVNSTVADLQGRLRVGQSLADIASQAGTSRSELVAVIHAALSASGALVKDLPQDKIVQRIADHRQRTSRTPNVRSEPRPVDENRAENKELGSRLDVRL
jgi:hypothetical protein